MSARQRNLLLALGLSLLVLAFSVALPLLWEVLDLEDDTKITLLSLVCGVAAGVTAHFVYCRNKR